MPEQVAFIFPGQGSQYVGMGKELAAMYPPAQQTFDEADAALGYKLSQLCFEGPEEKLKLTEITQPAILTVSVAAARVLREKGITPQWVAGHSLGEYSAHVVAGTFSFEDAVRTVRNRGKYMQEAVPVGVGAMAAVLGLPAEDVEKICREAVASASSRAGQGSEQEVCSPANINSPEQIVISGSKAAVERAAGLAKEWGAKRAIMLPVSAPFHCALMKPAEERLAKDLGGIKLGAMQCPLVKNVDAELTSDAEAARKALVRQVTGAVKWMECVQTLLAQGARTLVEVGPGKVLCGLMRQIDRSKSCFGVEDEASLQKTVNHFSRAHPN
jgi:[acyl-carrier-protein] S-malonyltransferase